MYIVWLLKTFRRIYDYGKTNCVSCFRWENFRQRWTVPKDCCKYTKCDTNGEWSKNQESILLETCEKWRVKCQWCRSGIFMVNFEHILNKFRPMTIGRRSHSHVTWHTAQSVLEYESSLTRIFPYKDRIYDSVLIRENTSQIKLACILYLFFILIWRMVALYM